MYATSDNSQPMTLTVDGTEGVPISYPLPGKMPDYYRTLPNGGIEELTRSEYKEAMRKEWTIRRPVPQCGHRFTPGKEPRHRNCEGCWFAFFQVHGELTQACDEVFNKFGEAGLSQLRGPKFTKNFLRFMSTLAQWKKIQETNEQRIGGAGEGGGSDDSLPSGPAGVGSTEDGPQAAD